MFIIRQEGGLYYLKKGNQRYNQSVKSDVFIHEKLIFHICYIKVCIYCFTFILFLILELEKKKCEIVSYGLVKKLRLITRFFMVNFFQSPFLDLIKNQQRFYSVVILD